ncbi:hypothetical protein [Suttonella ornithocola]|nr:hypothetical protein [Suttonella ornithocola]
MLVSAIFSLVSILNYYKAFAHRPYGYSTKGQVCHGSDIVQSAKKQNIL